MIRWGILGTARINRRIIPAMRLARRSDLLAVASRDRTRAEQYAAEWSIPRAVAGYQALLDDASIDAVYIPLPNTDHVPWTLAAIAAGKHVLCEKPLALDPADVDRIAAAAASAGVVVEEFLIYMHQPLTTRVMGLVNEGAVGSVRAVVSGFTFTLESAANIRTNPALGGGALWDVGGYPVTYAQLIAGHEPKMVFGTAHWHESGVDDQFMGLLRFDPGGMTANIYAGFRVPYRIWLEILGSDGSLTVPNPFKPGPLETLELERNGVVERIEVPGSPEIFVKEIEDFEASVLDAAPQIVTLAESRRTAATLLALQASARDSRRRVAPQPKGRRRMYPQQMEAAGSTVLWRLFRKGPAKTDRCHAVILPGGPPHTLACFANDELDRVENYETMDLAMFRADDIKRSLLAEDWKED